MGDANPGGSEPLLIDALAAKAAAGGQAEHDALINGFLETVVVVPSGSDPAKGPLQPVLVDVDGVSHMLVCDSLVAVRVATDLAQYAVSMKGIDVVRGVAPGHALLVRTPTTGFAIDEALLNEIRSR